jgi:hypothetical protein
MITRHADRIKFGLSLAAGFLGGALALLVFQGPVVVAEETPPARATPSVVSAEEFRLMDKQGRLRGLFSFSADGEPYLTLIDQQDTRRVWVGLAAETGMAIRDVDGKTRVFLSLDQDGLPSLVVRDRKHQSKVFHP